MGNICHCHSDPDDTNEDVVPIPLPNEKLPLDAETEALNRARRLLTTNLDEFLLENILMSVQFFTNYDSEIEKLRNEIRNQDSMDLHLKTSFHADTLLDRVSENVRFQPKHGPNKKRNQAFQPSRVFLSHDNIEIVFTEHAAHTNRPTVRPYYKLVMDPCDEANLSKAGYVNLKESETLEEETIYERVDGELTPRSKEDEDGDVEMEDFLRNTKKAANIFRKPGREMTQSELRLSQTKMRLSMQPRTTLTATPRPMMEARKSLLNPPVSNSTYGYSTIQSLARSKSLYDSRMGNIPSSSSAVPRVCFRQIQVPRIKDRRRTAHGLGALFMTFNLLESSAFMGHFCDVFAERLADVMNLDHESLNQATVQGWYINCPRGQDVLRVTPCIEAKEWPECGTEFLRPVSGDVPWPTPEMVATILKLGCSLIPIGYLQRRGENPQFDLQWKIDCPKASKYLLLHTMHAHVRAYLFLLVLYKTFFEIEDNCLSLGQEHLLHLVFWEVTKDFMAWPEDRPWKTLQKLLQNLSKALDKRKIKDFFFRGRNLLESTPIMFINRTKAMLFQLLEHPVPHVLLALKNLNFKPDFYPILDFNKLYRLITIKDVIEFVNPMVRATQGTNWTFSPDQLSDRGDEYDEDEEDDEKAWKEDFRRQVEIERAAKAVVQARAVSMESIDLFKETQQDSLRRQEILKTFIAHYIRMAEKSREYAADTQASLYIFHAKLLNQLLREESQDKTDAVAFTRRIDKLEGKTTATVEDTRSSERNVSIQFRELPTIPLERDEEAEANPEINEMPKIMINRNPNFFLNLTSSVERTETILSTSNKELNESPKTSNKELNQSPKTSNTELNKEVNQSPKTSNTELNKEMNSSPKTSNNELNKELNSSPKTSNNELNKELNESPTSNIELNQIKFVGRPVSMGLGFSSQILPPKPVTIIDEVKSERSSSEDTRL